MRSANLTHSPHVLNQFHNFHDYNASIDMIWNDQELLSFRYPLLGMLFTTNAKHYLLVANYPIVGDMF